MGLRTRLTFRGNIAVGRHGWLRLTPAYSLHLVRELLKGCGPADFVLEPFSGTGTTPLVCASLGVRCDAVDINPFLVWLGNLKLTRFDGGVADDLRSASTTVADRARARGTPLWKPNLHQIEKWWDPPTLVALAKLSDAIREPTERRTDRVRDLLRVAFCRVMIQSANVSFGHQSMSFRKARDEAALVEETPQLVAGRLADAFEVAAVEVADSIAVEPLVTECRVYLGDSRDLPAALPGCGRRYTAVITSPPYPNRMSYIRELRPYMYWLGYLSDGRAAGELDWKAIGGTWGCATSLLNTWAPNGHGGIPFHGFDRIVADIGKDHALLGRYVHKYFQDIKGHILGLRQVLAPGARCHYIVGNSKFYSTMLPVEAIYAALFEDAGFVNVSIEAIRKRTSKKELFEFVVSAFAP
ncbi:MAG TPA: SAM-dependent methyltransferase [Phycisphaerales bacterium]|nr:SAM-dependent methyltransferase [Phycisphaerales bacterium]